MFDVFAKEKESKHDLFPIHEKHISLIVLETKTINSKDDNNKCNKITSSASSSSPSSSPYITAISTDDNYHHK